MFRILYLIFILFMCVVLPLNFLIQPIVGNINTGGSPIFIIVMIGILIVCFAIAIIVYKRLSSQKEEQKPSQELEDGFKHLDELKKMQIQQNLGGEGATVTMKVTEEIVTDNSQFTEFEKTAMEDVKSQNYSDDIDWTISTIESGGKYNAEYKTTLTTTDKAKVAVKKTNKAVQITFKILGLIALAIIEILFIVGAVRSVTVFRDISFADMSVQSISDVAGYYVHSNSSSSTYGEKICNYSYTYSTNKKTDELAQKYEEYIKGVFSYNETNDLYYIIDPEDYDYIYSVDISYEEGGNTITLYYRYQERPIYII